MEFVRQLPEPDHLHDLIRRAESHIAQGGLDEAAALLRQAIALAPQDAALHGNMGNLLRDMGRQRDAEVSLRCALQLRPDYVEAFSNLGAVLLDQGRRPAAERCFRRALALKPGFGPALRNLGRLQLSTGRYREAGRTFAALVRTFPTDIDALLSLARALRAIGNPGAAAQTLEQALRIQPGAHEARLELGRVLHDQGRPLAALSHFEAVLDARPDNAEAHLGAGICANLLGDYPRAERALREAVRLRPDGAEAYNSLGDTLRNMRRFDEAAVLLDSALRLRPGFPEAQVSLAFLNLQTGNYRDGWRLYEARWRAAPWRNQASRVRAADWQGEPLAGRTLLLHAEQGLGDTLQFCRYACLIPPGGRVTLRVPAPLVRLLKSLAQVDDVIATNDPAPAPDLRCGVMSLPHIFGTRRDTVPATIPYFVADKQDVARWRERLAPLPGRRIGLAWAGDPAMAADARRSIAPGLLSVLAGLPGISFVSLQKGPAAAGLAESGLAALDAGPLLRDFADTAALVSLLDLVISVDTAVVHLAGALGRPTWLLNRFDTCWRWTPSSSTSPWYPSLRIFHQATPGNWDGVLRRVREALRAQGGGATGQNPAEPPGP